MDIKLPGCWLHVIETDKFKNTLISIKFKNELNRETSSIRALLAMCLIAGTNEIQGPQALASYLENCFGANVSSNVSTKGKAQIIHLTSSFVNERFLPMKEDLFKKQVALMRDLLFAPYHENGVYPERIVLQKKRELKDRLAALKDDKYAYALDQTLELMGEDQILGISGVGYEEDIDTITSEMLSKALQQMIQEDTIEIYVVGKLSNENIAYLKAAFPFKERQNNYEAAIAFEPKNNLVKEKVEVQDITQAKLNMGFSVGIDFSNEKHEALTIMNGILGAFSHSRLFKNVREKHSLCYYISSTYDAFNGIVLISCGIEAKDVDKVKTLVLDEIEDLQNGHITDEETMITKLMFENSLRKARDEAGSMIGLKYNRDIIQKQETLDEYLEKLMAVTKEDIIWCAQQLKLNTIYLLKGEDDNENETL